MRKSVPIIDVAVIDIELRRDLLDPIENAFGSAWRVYNTGEKCRIWCGEKWGDWLCWNCYVTLFKRKKAILQMERGKLIKLLGGYMFYVDRYVSLPITMLHDNRKKRRTTMKSKYEQERIQIDDILKDDGVPSNVGIGLL